MPQRRRPATARPRSGVRPESRVHSIHRQSPREAGSTSTVIPMLINDRFSAWFLGAKLGRFYPPCVTLRLFCVFWDGVCNTGLKKEAEKPISQKSRENTLARQSRIQRAKGNRDATAGGQYVHAADLRDLRGKDTAIRPVPEMRR